MQLMLLYFTYKCNSACALFILELVAVDQLYEHMLCPVSRSGMEPRQALLCWGHFVVLRFPPGFSLLSDLCTSNSPLTLLSATTVLKQPMTLP